MGGMQTVSEQPRLAACVPRAAPFRAPVPGAIGARRARLAPARAAITDHTTLSLQGTSRRVNEDRYAVELDGDYAYLAVFDGHGGTAVSDWLQKNLAGVIADNWQEGGNASSYAVAAAFLQADRTLLAPKKGFFGQFGERGVGGSKCGATGAVAIVSQQGGKARLLAANVGDSRILVVGEDGDHVQLTVDHVPDSEGERNRIESQNPNPKLPLVRLVENTWRVGGILALSRAFGDAYMKGSLQFEGPNTAGSDGYSAGFGLVAEPNVAEVDLPGGGWLVLATDGLFDNGERGSGGLQNADVAAYLKQNAGQSLDALAAGLAEEAQAAGSNDDVTVVLAKLC